MNWLHRRMCRSAYWQKTLAERLPKILSHADLGDEVLEVGPGPGLTSDLLRHQVHRLTTLELDPRLAASLRLRMQGTNVAVVTGDAAAMPFRDAAFSGCATFTMLHHVPSPQMQDAVLREIQRVLRPGGELVGSDSRTSAFMRVIHLGDTFVPVPPDTFASRLEAAGFEDVHIEIEPDFFRFHARRPLEFAATAPPSR